MIAFRVAFVDNISGRQYPDQIFRARDLSHLADLVGCFYDVDIIVKQKPDYHPSPTLEIVEVGDMKPGDWFDICRVRRDPQLALF